MFSTQLNNGIPICLFFFYIISLFAAELGEPKIDIEVKGSAFFKANKHTQTDIQGKSCMPLIYRCQDENTPIPA